MLILSTIKNEYPKGLDNAQFETTIRALRSSYRNNLQIHYDHPIFKDYLTTTEFRYSEIKKNLNAFSILML